VPDLPSGDYVCLSVKDEGEGMDAATLEKATEPFFTTKGVGKGTGLGLPMIQGLMAQSGGRLALNSVPGKGTTAELWLPLAEDIQIIEPEPMVEPTDPEHVAPLTVLAVDDDFLVLMNTVLMLEDLGHTTMQAQSAEEALQVLEQGPLPDVIITDHAMPHTTGADLARIVMDRYPGIPVILATGYAELPSGQESSLPRLAKPFGQVPLQRALAAAVAAD
jgi:CheY-like chemotaxis protein